MVGSDYTALFVMGTFLESSGLSLVNNSWDDILKFAVLLLLGIISRFAHAWIKAKFSKISKSKIEDAENSIQDQSTEPQ